MATTIAGVVRDGKVVPITPLPDGMAVQILVPDLEDVELLAELAEWRAGNAKALERVEKLADEDASHAQG